MRLFEKLLFAESHIKELQSQNLDLFDDNMVLANQNAALAARLKDLLALSQKELSDYRKEEVMAKQIEKTAALKLEVKTLKMERERMICRLAELHKANPPVQITIQSKYNE